MKKLLAAIAMVFCLIGTSVAQDMKFGHINSSELLQAMPESKKVQQDLEAYARQLESQMTTMSSEYQAKVTEYQTNEQVWGDIVLESKMREISDLEKRIQEFQQQAQGSLSKKEQQLFQPLLDKAQKAIDEVAKANGYGYVFDTSTGAIVHYPDGNDLLPLVKKHLGIQ